MRLYHKVKLLAAAAEAPAKLFDRGEGGAGSQRDEVGGKKNGVEEDGEGMEASDLCMLGTLDVELETSAVEY